MIQQGFSKLINEIKESSKNLSNQTLLYSSI